MMNNTVFGKSIKNVRENRDIKLVKIEERTNYLSEPSHHPTKSFTENLLALEMKKSRCL